MRINRPDYIKTLFFFVVLLIVISCRKDPGRPLVVTTGINEITQTSAQASGNVTDDGGARIVQRGICWNETGTPEATGSNIPVDGETGPYSCELSSLEPNTTYYVRAYATNEAGTGYGNEVTFTTLPVLSVSISTVEIKSITATGAVSGGNISDDGGGNVSSRGVCWAETENPTTDNFKSEDGTGKGIYNSYLTGLKSLTKYYIRAYGIIGTVTCYGDQLSFTTDVSQSNPIVFNPGLDYGTVSDIDGNSYKTIQIGDQVWMAENLKSTKYNDGSSISNVIPDQLWNSFSSGAYCLYNNDISYKEIYGALYNWYAVVTGKLCPTGWHIPSHIEWMDMIDNTGGILAAGGRMKEVGTNHWHSPNDGATNESGFTGLPAGIRTVSGYFQEMGSIARWWKSTEGEVVEVSYESSELKTDAGCVYRRGLSLRCVKD